MRSVQIDWFMLVRISLIIAVLMAGSALTPAVHAADFFKGETIYRTYCESCHGARGRGVIGGAPNFTRGQGLMKPDALLYDTILKGKNAMPAFRGVLTEEEFYDVITYIRSFL
jgi:mono/diheme cytochrome c family protein